MKNEREKDKKKPAGSGNCQQAHSGGVTAMSRKNYSTQGYKSAGAFMRGSERTPAAAGRGSGQRETGGGYARETGGHTGGTARSRRKWAALVICAVILFAAAFGGSLSAWTRKAEAEGTEAWIMCQPGDWVHARTSPSRKGGSLGRLETGDMIHINGRSRDGYMRAVQLSLEESEGWIFGGYIVTEKPADKGGAWYRVKSSGRVAARKYIEGPRRCWVVDGSMVQVWYTADGWAVTSKGYIKTEFLEEYRN